MGRIAARLVLVVVLVSSSAGRSQDAFYESYESGLAAERSGRWEAAREAFLRAAEARPEPGRRVKTYGLNFLDVYDPWAHLARVESEIGALDDASTHLARARAAGATSAGELDRIAAAIQARRKKALPTPPAIPTPAPTATPTPVPAAARPTAVPTPAVIAMTAPMGTAIPAAALRPTPAAIERQAPPTALPTATGPAPVLTASPTPSPTAVAVVPRPEGSKPAGPGRPSHLSLWVASAGALVILAGVLRRFARRRRPVAPVLEHQPTLLEPRPRTAIEEIRRFGEYDLMEKLGSGGMATTYRARRRRDGQIAAVKVPHAHLLDSPSFNERFLREGSLGATLHHPNIIRIYETGEVEKVPYMAMELLAGRTLEKALTEGEPLGTRRALEVARGIAAALDYAHLKGVVHRDLKPDNVMLLPDGSVKVMDYGIARVVWSPGLTATDMYLGTPFYSAPEAVYPQEVDARSDLYSLGVILYRMLAGQVPFTGTGLLEVLEAHRTQPVPPLPAEREVPAAVEKTLGRLLAKSKDDRYRDAEEFLRDLDAILNTL